MCSLPCNQTSTTKCCLCMQLCSGTAAVCNPGFWLWETFQRPEREKKNGRIDFAVVQILGRKTSSWSCTQQERASKRIHASQEKGIAYGLLLTHAEGRSNPPPYLPPTTLTNSNCLYRSFPSVPTINCPLCGGMNSWLLCKHHLPPNFANAAKKREHTRNLSPSMLLQ